MTAVVLGGNGSISLIWSCLGDDTKPPLREEIESTEHGITEHRDLNSSEQEEKFK